MDAGDLPSAGRAHEFVAYLQPLAALSYPVASTARAQAPGARAVDATG